MSLFRKRKDVVLYRGKISIPYENRPMVFTGL